ncbi:hypothetical protein RBLE17_10570 [Rhodobacteraceae bacterium LE17]|nr:hypothetical protein [Rhodobacteraceae bacterium LE17]
MPLFTLFFALPQRFRNFKKLSERVLLARPPCGYAECTYAFQ